MAETKEIQEIKEKSVWKKPDGQLIEVLYGGVFSEDEHVAVRNKKTGRRSRPKAIYFFTVYDRVR